MDFSEYKIKIPGRSTNKTWETLRDKLYARDAISENGMFKIRTPFIPPNIKWDATSENDTGEAYETWCDKLDEQNVISENSMFKMRTPYGDILMKQKDETEACIKEHGAAYYMKETEKKMLKEMLNTDYSSYARKNGKSKYFDHKKIIFSPPCTIVIWKDGSKTIVRCSEGDTFDLEKGLALCYMKRALGITANHQLHKFMHGVIDDPKNYPNKKTKQKEDNSNDNIK